MLTLVSSSVETCLALYKNFKTAKVFQVEDHCFIKRSKFEILGYF